MPIYYPPTPIGVSNTGNTAGNTGTSFATNVIAGTNNITISQSTAANGVNTIWISGGAGGAFSAGASNLGNTAGDTGTVSNRVVFAGGNNITVSQSTNAAGATITISGANAGGAQTGISGIGAGAATATSGTVIFSNSNGLAFGMNGQTMTGSYTVPTVPAQFTGGISTNGNTAGDTGLVTARMVLAGGNNITLSGSTNGGSITVSVSGANQTVQTQNLHNVTLSGNTAGAMAQISSGTLTLAGGNNITLSQAGNAVTISAFNQSAQTFVGGIAAGGATATSGTVIFSNSNGVSFGLNGQTVTASYTVPTVPAQFSGGMSTNGNTAGDTAFVTGRLALIGGNNITLSGSTNAGSMSITVSAFNQSAQTQNIVVPAAAGNTYTSGTVLYTGVNLTVTTNGQTISISASAQSAESQSIGASNLGNTSGTSGVASGAQVRYVIVASDGMIGSQSINGASGTLSLINSWSTATTISQVSNANAIGANAGRFALEGHQHAGIAAMAAGSNTGNTAGNTATQYGTWVIAGTNNITVSGSTGAGGVHTVWLSVPTPGAGAYSAGLSNIGNTSGNTGLAGNQLVLAGGNAITLSGSTNGGSMTITISGGGGGAAFSAGVSTGGNTSGNTGTVSNQVIFAGGNNITLSQSTAAGGATITVSGAAQAVAPTISAYANIPWAWNTGTGAATHASMSFNRAWVFPLTPPDDIFPGNMTVGTVLLNMSFSHSNSTASTASHSSTISFGIYQLTNRTQLTLVVSGSTSWGTGAANNSISSLYNGMRWLTLHSSLFNTSLTLSNNSYWGLLWFRSSNDSIATASHGIMAARMGNSVERSGFAFAASSTASSYVKYYPFHGLYSATFTTAMPGSIAQSEMAYTGSAWAALMPDVRLIASNASNIYGII